MRYLRKEVLFLKLENKKIGFAFTGSFCTFKAVIEELKKIKNEKADILPIMSFNSYNLDTKFGKAQDYIDEVKEISEKEQRHHSGTGGKAL